MKLKIHSIDVTNEIVWIKVLDDCNLKNYVIFDSTFTSQNRISNHWRHSFWFPDSIVKKGDWIKLQTNVGTNTSFINKTKTTTYVFHWGLNSKVWNNSTDIAVLIEINTWQAVKAFP